jgi:hypothetical protein
LALIVSGIARLDNTEFRQSRPKKGFRPVLEWCRIEAMVVFNPDEAVFDFFSVITGIPKGKPDFKACSIKIVDADVAMTLQPLPYTEATPGLTTYPRGFVAVTVKTPVGKDVRSVSTHFQHNVETRVIAEAMASDHRPVFAVLKVK